MSFIVNTQSGNPENINLINVTGSGETETEIPGWLRGDTVVGGDSPVSLSTLDQFTRWVKQNPVMAALGGLGILLVLKGGRR